MQQFSSVYASYTHGRYLGQVSIQTVALSSSLNNMNADTKKRVEHTSTGKTRLIQGFVFVCLFCVCFLK